MQFLCKNYGGIDMVISKNKLRFLYPYSNQFPFDSVATKIVRELEKRSWSVPGTMIEFYNSGSKYERYQMVNSIVGSYSRPY